LNLPNTFENLDIFLGCKSFSTGNRFSTQSSVSIARFSRCAKILSKHAINLLLVDTSLDISKHKWKIYNIINYGMSISGENVRIKWRPKIVRMSKLLISEPYFFFNVYLRAISNCFSAEKKNLISRLIFGQKAGITQLVILHETNQLTNEENLIRFFPGKGQEILEIKLMYTVGKFTCSHQPTFVVIGLIEAWHETTYLVGRFIRIGMIELNSVSQQNSPQTLQRLCQFHKLLFNLTKIKCQRSEQGLLLLEIKTGMKFILSPGYLGKHGILWRMLVNYNRLNLKYADIPSLIVGTAFKINHHKTKKKNYTNTKDLTSMISHSKSSEGLISKQISIINLITDTTINQRKHATNYSTSIPISLFTSSFDIKK
jgi:hypothetical protein